MTKVGQTYKCVVCTNEVVVAQDGVGVLACCGRPMELAG